MLKIDEKDKQTYIDAKNKQDKDKQDASSKDNNMKKNKCVQKLKDLGFDQDQINAILGDAYGNTH